jgi:hypothetical protein
MTLTTQTLKKKNGMVMARSRAGAHPKWGWQSQCGMACADQWPIGCGQQELLVVICENRQDHEQDDKNPEIWMGRGDGIGSLRI